MLRSLRRLLTIAGVVLAVLLALRWCVPERGAEQVISARVAKQVAAGGLVNLAQAAPQPWQRVCIFGPYQTAQQINATLGFDWLPPGQVPKVQTNDAISLLVFVQDEKVVTSVEQARGRGDFSNLSRRCFARDAAVFQQVAQPAAGWPALFPVEEARR